MKENLSWAGPQRATGVLFCLSVAMVGPLHAQATGGTLEGRLTGEQGLRCLTEPSPSNTRAWNLNDLWPPMPRAGPVPAPAHRRVRPANREDRLRAPDPEGTASRRRRLAHLWYGLLLEGLGRTEEALAERTRPLELDPLSLSVNTALGDTFSLVGQQDRAIEQYERALDLEPRYPGALRGLGWAYLLEGRARSGLPKLEEAVAVAGEDPMLLSWLGHAYGLAGRRTDARRVLGILEGHARQHYVSPYHLAVVHAGLGEPETAFLHLDESLRERAPVLFHVKVDPLLAPLRSDRRFHDLLRRLALE